MVKRILRYFYIFGPILFLVVLFKLDLRKAMRIIADANPILVVLGLSTISVEIFLRAKMLQRIGLLFAKIPLLACIKAHLIDLCLSTLTPGGLGGLLKFYKIEKASQLTKTQSLALVLLDKSICLATLLMLVFVGACIVALESNRVVIVLFIIGLAVLSLKLKQHFALLLETRCRKCLVVLTLIPKVLVKTTNKVFFKKVPLFGLPQSGANNVVP